jgi:hypothetical protein
MNSPKMEVLTKKYRIVTAVKDKLFYWLSQNGSKLYPLLLKYQQGYCKVKIFSRSIY